MTRTAALARLADYDRLYHAHVAAAETTIVLGELPIATLHWYSAAPLLLAFCRQVITDGLDTDPDKEHL